MNLFEHTIACKVWLELSYVLIRTLILPPFYIWHTVILLTARKFKWYKQIQKTKKKVLATVK
jgi:hypothetical protein